MTWLFVICFLSGYVVGVFMAVLCGEHPDRELAETNSMLLDQATVLRRDVRELVRDRTRERLARENPE